MCAFVVVFKMIKSDAKNDCRSYNKVTSHRFFWLCPSLSKKTRVSIDERHKAGTNEQLQWELGDWDTLMVMCLISCSQASRSIQGEARQPLVHVQIRVQVTHVSYKSLNAQSDVLGCFLFYCFFTKGCYRLDKNGAFSYHNNVLFYHSNDTQTAWCSINHICKQTLQPESKVCLTWFSFFREPFVL